MEQETLIQTEAPVRERRLYIESYGCAMNFSDSEIVATIMPVSYTHLTLPTNREV